MASIFEKLSAGLSKSRDKISSSLASLGGSGFELDEDFYENLEEALISADLGMDATLDIVEKLRKSVKPKSKEEFMSRLHEFIAAEFETAGDPFQFKPAIFLFVGINGTGKTTSVGKIAYEAAQAGSKVVLGSADTFRAAAIEQLDVWAKRAQVEVIYSKRGADPASVAYETLAHAKEVSADLVLIDTAGRLHTSLNLMEELEKISRVVRDNASVPVFTILVMDATTGQNGLVQAKEFNKYLALDAVILTKLDGTAKGGIAVAISRALHVPIARVGVGEGISDLQSFDPLEFARALVGTDV